MPVKIVTPLDRFLGCLLGGAVGDALGAPVEFMTHSEILAHFGSQGVTDYAPAYGGIGMITDDTQMTLFTAEGLLRGWVRGCLRGITSYSGTTAHAYMRWLRTQNEQPDIEWNHESENDGWLFRQRELHTRRAPGNTCLSALRDRHTQGTSTQNNSKGCGGVMRVAPVGLFYWQAGMDSGMLMDNGLLDAFQLGTELAALTHGHPTGSLTGGVLATLVLGLTNGIPLSEALIGAKTILRKKCGHEETLREIEKAEALALSDTTHHKAITQLGQGWVAEEALAISIYCALVARDFKHGVLLAVNHDGDSDSTGAITGNLLGAKFGVQAIPESWVTQLELHEVIAEIATDLFEFRNWALYTDCDDFELVKRISTKYPGC